MQRRHYSKAAAEYDRTHVHAGDPHGVALGYIGALCDLHGIGTVLDVGAGTGRGVEFLLHRGLRAVGVEPVREMIGQALKSGIPAGNLVLGRGEKLPFTNGAFDAVVELGVFHHLPRPEPVLKEMMRVAKRAIFLSDDNRFGRGRYSRPLKPLLYRLGLYGPAMFVFTRGRGYTTSDSDGVGYSYSVYDAFPTLSQWANRVFFVPTSQADTRAGAFQHPLMSSPHVLLCALRDPDG